MSKSEIVKVSCLRCKTQDIEAYQEIFDETGIEMDLSTLLKECFGLTVIKNEAEFQVLCSSCLDALIEVYDVMEMGLTKHSSNSFDEKSQDYEESIQESLNFEENQIDSKSDSSINEEDSPVEVNECESIDSNKDEDFLGFDDDNLSEENDSELAESVQYIDELDNTNLLEYKIKLFGSDFKQLNVPLSVECRICSTTLDNHKGAYLHALEHHHDNKYICIFDEKCKPIETSVELSYHLILTHYDLDSFDLFCSCPACGNSYKNFKTYNQHSCHKQKNLSRVSQECTQCLKTFSSNKRFRFHHQFHMKNHRPKACLICDEHFRDEDDFYEHIMYKHAKDPELICTMCDRNFTSKASLENHLLLHQANRKYKCSYCEKDYLYSHMLKNHVKEKHINKKPLECDICLKPFIKESALKTHRKQYHTINVEMEIEYCGNCGLIETDEEKLQKHLKSHEKPNQVIKKETLSVAMACEHCEAAFVTIEQLKNHRNIHKPNEFICSYCPVIQDEFKKLMTHKLTHKNFERNNNFPITRHYVCKAEGCNVTHILWTGLRNHKTSKHPVGRKVFNCPVCNEKFLRMPELNTHLKKQHKGKKFVSCPVCEKVFNNRTAMSVHLSKIHNTAKLKCDECESSYFNKESLERHKNYQHRRKECSLCKKVIKTKNHDLHMNLVHKNIKRFFCKICDKGYYQKSDWLEHEKAIHEKQKRFQCKLCDYETYWVHSIKIHELKHEQKRPFACNYCRSTFDRKSGLQRHLKSHRVQTKFMCPFGCEVFFSTRLVLCGHLKDGHADEPDLENIINNLSDKRQKSSKSGPSKRARLEKNTKADIFIDDDDGLEHEEPIFEETGNSYEVQEMLTSEQNEIETTEGFVEDGIVFEVCGYVE